MQLAFGLTAAECRVALLLGEGLCLSEISARLGVSRNTVKSQAQAVYGKAGVHRQTEFMKVLSGLGELERPAVPATLAPACVRSVLVP